jgi:cell wall-associated NlpC family hydrolase
VQQHQQAGHGQTKRPASQAKSQRLADEGQSLHSVGQTQVQHTADPTQPQRYISQDQPHRIVETADDYIGVPYVWGGSKPAGFDCSGFVQYVYRKHGVELPRTSKEMFAKAGDFVPAAELEPGDLVFFAERNGNRRTTSHVGIYIGDNRFISATNSFGVKVSSLNGSYWGPQYIGAKRVM